MFAVCAVAESQRVAVSNATWGGTFAGGVRIKLTLAGADIMGDRLRDFLFDWHVNNIYDGVVVLQLWQRFLFRLTQILMP